MLSAEKKAELRSALDRQITRVLHDVLPKLDGTLAAADVRKTVEFAQKARSRGYVPWMQSGHRQLKRISA